MPPSSFPPPLSKRHWFSRDHCLLLCGANTQGHAHTLCHHRNAQFSAPQRTTHCTGRQWIWRKGKRKSERTQPARIWSPNKVSWRHGVRQATTLATGILKIRQSWVVLNATIVPQITNYTCLGRNSKFENSSLCFHLSHILKTTPLYQQLYITLWTGIFPDSTHLYCHHPIFMHETQCKQRTSHVFLFFACNKSNIVAVKHFQKYIVQVNWSNIVGSRKYGSCPLWSCLSGTDCTGN